MNRRQLIRLLTDEGFVSIARGKHETFAKESVKIQIPSSGKELNWRLQKMIMLQVRKMRGTNEQYRELARV